MNPLKPSHLRQLFSLRYNPHFPATATASPSQAILTTRHSNFHQNSQFFSTSPYGVWFGVTKPVINRGIVIVPKGKAAVIERNRRYSKTVTDAGLWVLNPFVGERIAYVYPLGHEEAILLNPYVGTVGCEGGFAKILIDGVIRLKIVDPKLAFYSGRDGGKLINDVLSHAQDALLDELRGMMLFFRPSAEDTLKNCKDTLRKKIVKTINQRSIKEWGLQCAGCDLYDIYPHPDPLESELKSRDIAQQDAQAEKALAMFAIWKSFDKAMVQILEVLDDNCSPVKPEAYHKSTIWATQAFIRVLTDFLPFVLELANELEYSQPIKEDITLTSESLGQCIKAIILATNSDMDELEATTDALEKSFASVFKSVNHLLKAITSPASESLEPYSPQGTMEQLKNAQTRVSGFLVGCKGAEGAGQFLSRVYLQVLIHDLDLQRKRNTCAS